MKRVLASAAAAMLFALAAPVSAQFSLPSLESMLQAPQAAPAPASGAVDLLAEASSYVPPFYLGRALPSAQTSVRLEALPHLHAQNGSEDAPETLVYTWRVDDLVVGAASGPGRSTAILPPPPLFGSATYSVDAAAPDGSARGSASVTFSSVDPQITLYENHPLYGIEYYNALSSGASIPDLEMTFAGVTYFAAEAPDDSRLSWAWQINGLPVAASSTGASEITINAQNSSGAAALSVSLTSLADLALDARGAWQFTFGGAGAAGAAPAQSPSDAFHRSQ